MSSDREFQPRSPGCARGAELAGSGGHVNGVAHRIANNVRGRLPDPSAVVRVEPYSTDRAAASVVVLDVRAMAWQARDGILTRAAGEAGVEVRAWGS
jgi:hypothetical protein